MKFTIQTLFITFFVLKSKECTSSCDIKLQNNSPDKLSISYYNTFDIVKQFPSDSFDMNPGDWKTGSCLGDGACDLYIYNERLSYNCQHRIACDDFHYVYIPDDYDIYDPGYCPGGVSHRTTITPPLCKLDEKGNNVMENVIYGVDTANNIYYRQGNSWIILGSTSFKYVSSGANTVMGITADDTVYHLEVYPNSDIGSNHGRFILEPEIKLTQLDIGCEGEVWGVNSEYQVYMKHNVKSKWRLIPGGLFKQVSVGRNGHVWGASHVAEGYGSKGYRWNPVSQAWDYMHMWANQVDVSCDGRVTILDNVNTVINIGADGYPEIGSDFQLDTISFVDNEYWGTRNNEIFKSNNFKGPWEKVPGGLKQIDAGASVVCHEVVDIPSCDTPETAKNVIWGVDSLNQAWYRKNNENVWKMVNFADFKYISAGGQEVWGIATNNDTYRLQNSKDIFKKVDGGDLVQLDVGCDGSAWGVNSNGNMLKYVNNGWQAKPGSFKQVSVGQGNNVWAVKHDNNVERWNEEKGNWDSMFHYSKQIEVTCSGSVFSIDLNDVVYSYSDVNNAWAPMSYINGKDLRWISGGNNNEIWGITLDNRVYSNINGTNVWDMDPVSPTEPGLIHIDVGSTIC